MEDIHLRHGINSLVARFISRDTRATGLKEAPEDVAKGHTAGRASVATRDCDGDEPANSTLLSELLRQREELLHAHDTLTRRVTYLSRTKESLANSSVRENSSLLEINNEYRQELQQLKQKEAMQAAAAALAERQSHVQGLGSSASSSRLQMRGSHETSTSQNIAMATPMLRKAPGGQHQHVRAGRLSSSQSQLLPALGTAFPLRSTISGDVVENGTDLVGASSQSKRLAALSQLSSSVDRVVSMIPLSAFADRVLPTTANSASVRSSALSTSLKGSGMGESSKPDSSGGGLLPPVAADIALEIVPPLAVRPLTSASSSSGAAVTIC